MSPRRAGRCAAVLAALVGVLATLLAPAAASASPLDEAARRIVAAVAPGDPLRVVTTRTGPGGRPLVEGVPVATRAQALDLVVRALADPGVDTVSMASRARATASDDTLRSRQWGMTRLEAETLWRRADGRATSRTPRAVVAVLDTGVDATHPDLRGNVLPGIDLVDPGTSAADPNGHGTHVAGIVAAVAGNRRGVVGLAPRAAVLPVRVLEADGAGYSDVIAAGIVRAADRRPHVVNLSLGLTADDPAFRRAVAYAQRRGVLVVAAAGNWGCPFLFRPTEYPAAYSGVVGVGSLDRSLTASGFSSCGSWVDVAAPGGDVWSTVPTRNRVRCTSAYCSLSGTSMAAPHVAAAAAIAMSRRGWSAATVAARIERTARDLGARGKDQTYGAGLLDARAVVG
jgi:cell wall-associated protease